MDPVHRETAYEHMIITQGVQSSLPVHRARTGEPTGGLRRKTGGI